jgi:hypothetical protein
MSQPGSIFNSQAISRAHSGSYGNWGSPFLDMASLAMPDQNKNLLQWCEHIYDMQETYRMAQERIISYFNTDIEVESPDMTSNLGDDEKEKWRNAADRMGLLNTVQEIDRDRACYGNGFATMMVPFKRLLVCPKCYAQFPLNEVYKGRHDFDFDWQLPNFIASCPACKTGSGYRGKWHVNDMPVDLEDNLKIKLWSPHEIEIVHDLYTDEAQYIWRIPEDYKKQVRSGHLWHLERASMQVLRAIQNNNLFMFHPDAMFHMREPVLSGRRNRGWGLSRILVNFRQIWYVQVLRRYNEAIGLDYIIPFRLITPEQRSGGGQSGLQAMTDPMKTVNMGNFQSELMRMLRQRQRDPAGWHFLPFPVKYQALGGDASQLAPKDLLDQAHETLLNGAGTPVELYRGSLQLQTAPVSLRLFEATWFHLVHDNNRFLRWAASQISQILSWEQVAMTMRRVTHTDDFNKQMAVLQLMMGQAISQTTGLRGMGLDWDTEQRQIAEESRRQAELQAEVQEEMEQAAFGEQIAKGQAMPGGQGGQPGAPGAPMGDPMAAGGGGGVDPMTGQPGPVSSMVSGGNAPVTPTEMMQQAESIAMQMLGLPESQKDSELRLLKQKNEFMHSLVREKMDAIRNRARTAGGSMLLGQQPSMPAAA